MNELKLAADDFDPFVQRINALGVRIRDGEFALAALKQERDAIIKQWWALHELEMRPSCVEPVTIAERVEARRVARVLKAAHGDGKVANILKEFMYGE